jgi:hypothetical protein
MKFAIAIAQVLIWLFFPATQVRWCRRWRARREAADYSRTLSGKARQSSSGDIFRCGRKCSRVSDSVRFSCGFHKEFLSSTVCAQPAIDFLLRGCDCCSRVSPAQMCDVLNALLDCRRVDVSGG